MLLCLNLYRQVHQPQEKWRLCYPLAEQGILATTTLSAWVYLWSRTFIQPQSMGLRQMHDTQPCLRSNSNEVCLVVWLHAPSQHLTRMVQLVWIPNVLSFAREPLRGLPRQKIRTMCVAGPQRYV
jgi:hypothetical protein